MLFSTGFTFPVLEQVGHNTKRKIINLTNGLVRHWRLFNNIPQGGGGAWPVTRCQLG